MGSIESHLKETLLNGQQPVSLPERVNVEPPGDRQSAAAQKQSFNSKDLDIDNLLNQLRRCCNEGLISRIGKRFLVRCEDSASGPAEILLDLKNGNGAFEWITNSNLIQKDVEISLRKGLHSER